MSNKKLSKIFKLWDQKTKTLLFVVPKIHGPEGEVELEWLRVHVAEGCAEHGKAVEGDDAVWRVDHQVFREAGLSAKHGLRGVARPAGEQFRHLQQFS